MAPSLVRYIVTSPATSAALRDALQQAIDDGSRTMGLTLSDRGTLETTEVEFTLVQARFRNMSAEFIGKLQDGSTATIIAATHPDLSNTPAQMTLMRRVAP